MDPVSGFHDLLARARGGDRPAIDELMVRIRPWIEQQARKAVPRQRPDGSASDLIQEALLRVWQKIDQFQGDGDAAQSEAMFRAWLGRIVARLGLNAIRDAAAQQRKPPGKLLPLNDGCAAGDSLPILDPSAGELTPSANVRAEERARLVQEAMARLADPSTERLSGYVFSRDYLCGRSRTGSTAITKRFVSVIMRSLAGCNRISKDSNDRLAHSSQAGRLWLRLQGCVH